MGGVDAADEELAVTHEDGTVSVLPPVSDFLKTDLSAPLLAQQKSAKKLDELQLLLEDLKKLRKQCSQSNS